MPDQDFTPTSSSWATEAVKALRRRSEALREEGTLPEPRAPRCPHCGDSGWRPVVQDGITRQVRCDCVLDRCRGTALGVPIDEAKSRLANYRVQPCNRVAVAAARAFLKAAQGDMFLIGGVGAGKTRLACSIANEWAFERGASTALFIRVPMTLKRLQPSRDEEAETERVRLERQLFTVALLVLDDVGSERDQATDYTRRTLLMVYEERGDRGLRTIWTSNKELPEIAAMQDDTRLASRIAGRADVVLIRCGDQRLHGRLDLGDDER